MRQQERWAIGAVVKGLRKSGAIDDSALDAIFDEMLKAANRAENYGSAEAEQITMLAGDIRDMREG
ncbi:hypothetical protein [Rhizorhabdus wittichii]|jgi:hypothetical protein|uniref:hypothetical protein n=1 Tax=Rhizorhabdus wittichii TaxID=160791 RepID=UPI000307FE6E|nr:hypothetical protein [Rhizorhabdus wittichii]